MKNRSWEETGNDFGNGPDQDIRAGKNLFWKFFFALLSLSIVLSIIGYGLGWFGEAAQVAQKEFGPQAALQKYEWFKEQSQAIKKMDQDVSNFQKRKDGIKDQFTGYGDNMAKWPPHIQASYNEKLSQASDDLIAVVSQRNNLVKDYNAASSKFNWSPFMKNADRPNQTFDELK